MSSLDNIVVVDVEATGPSPFSGVMTEFGAVHYITRQTYHGKLYDSMPSPENPAVPVLSGGTMYPREEVMRNFATWLRETVQRRPLFVSDNPAYDFMWIAYGFDEHGLENPFGHSGRRISDFYAGLQRNWSDTQRWKRWRRTRHDHNPVNDALGNVEALAVIMESV